jgi:hypothetical protein
MLLKKLKANFIRYFFNINDIYKDTNKLKYILFIIYLIMYSLWHI